MSEMPEGVEVLFESYVSHTVLNTTQVCLYGSDGFCYRTLSKERVARWWWSYDRQKLITATLDAPHWAINEDATLEYLGYLNDTIVA